MDYMLFETQVKLDNSRAYANHTYLQLDQHAETIKFLAKERRELRQLVTKRDSTIHRLRARVATLKETVATQAEQLQALEEEGEGEDIQGDGYSYVSNDNDYEEEEDEDLDFHQRLPAGMDTTFPIRIDGE
jgi:predicted nuclease with TOPRIM domain